MLLGPAQSLLPPGNLVILPNSECGLDDDDSLMCARNGFFHFERCTADAGGGVAIKVFNLDVQVRFRANLS